MARVKFITGEIYHVFNRGVEKRNVFDSNFDYLRFLESMKKFNDIKPIGSIYQNSFIKNDYVYKRQPLVSIVAYCLNPNHYHILLKQEIDGGISEFMKRLGGGYTRFFNEKTGRSGSLFQGKFKGVEISTNEQLLHMSAYVNLNFKVHKLKQVIKKTSSLIEYRNSDISDGICDVDIILEQFSYDRNKYKNFMEQVIKSVLDRRQYLKEDKGVFGTLE